MHEFTATAWSAPTVCANAASNCAVFGPVVNQRERSTATTSLISCSVIEGRKYGTGARDITHILFAGKSEAEATACERRR